MSTNHSSADGGGLALLPCPWCEPDKSAPRMWPPTCDQHTPYNPADRAYPVVRCSNCYVEVPGKDWDRSGRSAISAWNRRAANHFPELTNLLIEAEALLCDERGGQAANELAGRIRAALRQVLAAVREGEK